MSEAKFIGVFEEWNGQKVTFSTNALGRGLWKEDRQFLGTSQFTATTQKQFRDKVNKILEKAGGGR